MTVITVLPENGGHVLLVVRDLSSLQGGLAEEDRHLEQSCPDEQLTRERRETGGRKRNSLRYAMERFRIALGQIRLNRSKHAKKMIRATDAKEVGVGGPR
jgi:hypothetical protein